MRRFRAASSGVEPSGVATLAVHVLARSAAAADAEARDAVENLLFAAVLDPGAFA